MSAPLTSHHLSVPRSARYHCLGAPSPGVREVWFVLHGYGQLAADFLTPFEVLADPARLVVAPEGLSRFYLAGTHGRVGASWMTREERTHEVEDYLTYLDALCARVLERLPSPPATHVLGFSQGAATAARWAALGGSPVGRLTLWAGGLPPDLDLAAARERLAGQDLTLVVGLRDEAIPEERVQEEEQRLRAAGVPFRTLRFDGGHALNRALLVRLAQGP